MGEQYSINIERKRKRKEALLPKIDYSFLFSGSLILGLFVNGYDLIFLMADLLYWVFSPQGYIT